MESKGSESNGSDKSNPEVSLIFKGHWTQPQSTSTDPDVSSGTNPFNQGNYYIFFTFKT